MPSQGLKQVQKIIVTQEFRESLDVLQMPLPELQAYLEEQFEDNCLLEMEEAEERKNEGDEAKPGIEARRDVSEGGFEAEIDEMMRFHDGMIQNRESVSAMLQSKSAGPPYSACGGELFNCLQDYLLFQLHLVVNHPREERVGRYLIGNIDNDGYLQESIAAAAASLGIAPADVAQSLTLIQSFDPAGVGARDLPECLQLQLEAWPRRNRDPELHQIALGIIADYCEDLANRKLGRIAAKLKRSVEQIQKAVSLIRRLDPKPGRRFNQQNLSIYVVPDVFVKRSGNGFAVFVNEPETLRLKINPIYRQLLRKSWLHSPETVEYIKKKLRAAVRLMRNVHQRHLTLCKISEAIVKLQQSFFTSGTPGLQPLTLREVATVTGLHESTVSRCIDGKYLETPNGTFPLKYFFSTFISCDETQAASGTAVKSIIKTVVAKEDKRIPWSDLQLTEILKNKGIRISRRTVAKYREALKIPPSHLRRFF